ncbi:MAG: HNH endonuclease [Rhodobiaceae bacterium]|nr:HNH endonuclease [Rhodobiaceae bacterium]MCC0055901.1 HNH endonuclease [Rhodobiaceae bacterium]
MALANRDGALPWRGWYKTARWQKLRWSVLVRDLFTCRMCKRIEADTSKLVADHIKAHRGDEALFWDAENIQTLCKPCHDSAKQQEEQASLTTRGVWW